MNWRSTEPLKQPGSKRVHVALGSQSLETNIAHGEMRIYDRPKYVPPQLRDTP